MFRHEADADELGGAANGGVCGGVYQVNGDKPPGLPPVSRLDDKVVTVSVAGSMVRRRTSPQEPSEQLALAPIVNSASAATAGLPSGVAAGCWLHHGRGPNSLRWHASGESAAIHACMDPA